MIDIRLKISGDKALIKKLSNMEKKFSKTNITKLNKKRAEKFKEFTIEQVRSDSLGLKKISSATVKISTVGDHSPMYATGGLLDAMQIKNDKATSGVLVGYMDDTATNPETGKSYKEIAVLHHRLAGFRIPINDSNEGQSVKHWLKRDHGIIITNRDKLSKGYLHVKPRPFMYRSIRKYIDSNIDNKIVEEWIDEIMGGN